MARRRAYRTGSRLGGPVGLFQYSPPLMVNHRWFDPFLNSVLSKGEVTAVPVIRVFMVKELDDSFVGRVKFSDAVGAMFVLFDRFLGVSISESRTHELCSRVHPFPFHEIVNDFIGFLPASPRIVRGLESSISSISNSSSSLMSSGGGAGGTS